MQFTKLKVDSIVACLERAQKSIERALYTEELMRSMAAPADTEKLAEAACSDLKFVFDMVEEAKSQLTI